MPLIGKFLVALGMARKRYSDQDTLKLLREIELHLASGKDIMTSGWAAGVSDTTYYNWLGQRINLRGMRALYAAAADRYCLDMDKESIGWIMFGRVAGRPASHGTIDIDISPGHS